MTDVSSSLMSLGHIPLSREAPPAESLGVPFLSGINVTLAASDTGIVSARNGIGKLQ